jgi:uncharacterized LabA/DUF88 family protein
LFVKNDRHLIAGDSAFVPAVNVAKEEGIVTILYYSKAAPLYVHKELLDSCDETYEITEEIINGSKPKHTTPSHATI